MKKSKLLIPLAGLAGAATIAMPLVLTSCGETIAVDLEWDSSESWWIGGNIDISRKNTYNFTLKNSDSTVVGITNILTIMMLSEFPQPKSVKLNDITLAPHAGSTGKSYLYTNASGRSISGPLTLSIKFGTNISKADLCVKIS